MSVPLVLASRSPARLATLRAAGIEPTVRVSGVDEDAVLAAARARGELSHHDAVLELARAKCLAVADGVTDHAEPLPLGAVVVGCDSMLEFDGDILGKPGSPEVARARWQAMRGGTGVLHTGHWIARRATVGAEAFNHGATASTMVRFAELTDREIDDYVATGEPLHVAGAFTVDGLGGPFVESIDGDYHAVVGLSLPLLRRLLGECGIGITELWNRDAL